MQTRKSFAAEAQVEAGSTVDISVDEGQLFVRPLKRRKYVLREPLKAVTPKDVHREVDTGEPAGREA